MALHLTHHLPPPPFQLRQGACALEIETVAAASLSIGRVWPMFVITPRLLQLRLIAFPACSSRFMHIVQAFVCTHLLAEPDWCNISCVLEIPQVSLHAMFQFSYCRMAATSRGTCLTAVDRVFLDCQCGCLQQILSYVIGFNFA
jgi:hypothetical protein